MVKRTIQLIVLLSAIVFSPILFAENQEIFAPLIIDRIDLGEVELVLDKKNNTVLVKKDSLVFLLEPILNKKSFEALNSYPERLISGSQIEALGYKANFNEQTVDYILDIPVQFRNSRAIRFLPPIGTKPRYPVEPLKYSAFLNIRAQRNAHDQEVANNYGVLELGSRINPVSIDLAADYEDQRDKYWQKLRTRMIFDQPEQNRRWVMGDIACQLSDFQNLRIMTGASVSQNSDLGVGDYSQVVSREEILITTQSTVDVLINGQIHRTLRLMPGKYKFDDLPLQRGINSVQIRVHGEKGESTLIDSREISDETLLTKNFNQYCYSAGTINELDNVYGAQFFHRYGLKSNFTIGLNGQGDEDHQLLGLEILYGSIVGRWAINTQNEINDTTGDLGAAYSIDWRSFEIPLFRPTRANVNYASFGKSFASWGQNKEDSVIKSQTSLNVSSSLTDKFGISAGARWIEQQTGERLDPSRFVGVQYQLRSNMQASAEYSDIAGKDSQLFLFFNWSEPIKDANVFYQNLSRTESQKLQVSYNPPEKSGNIQANASHESSPTEKRNEGRVDAFFRHATLGASGSSSEGDFDDSSAYQLKAETALLWTPKGFLITRPIEDAFVIVQKPESLKADNIKINDFGATNSGELASNLRLALTEMSSYRDLPVDISLDDVDRPLKINKESYIVNAPILGGAWIDIDIESTKLVELFLKDSKGRPLSLKSGVIREQAASGTNETSFFTNKEGRVILEDLKVQKFTIVIFDRDYAERLIEITDEKWRDDEINLGEVTINLQ